MKTVVVRLITDKPVKKTAYQVKGVFMKQYPNCSMIPMLDGRYRNKYLYPRVQVKILNEQIFIVGIKEGAESVLELVKEIEELNFGNITFSIIDIDIEKSENQFIHVDQLLRYKFVSPWVALGNSTQNRYKILKNNDRIKFLCNLLGKNLVFLAREMQVGLNEKVYIKLRLNSLLPKPVERDKWGAFEGEFQANFILPNYIGIGNGITRGYGSIHGLFNPEELELNDKSSKLENESSLLVDLENDEEIQIVKVETVPKPQRKSKKKKSTKKAMLEKNDISRKPSIRPKPRKKTLNTKQPNQAPSDNNFNTAEYHKKQHKF